MIRWKTSEESLCFKDLWVHVSATFCAGWNSLLTIFDSSWGGAWIHCIVSNILNSYSFLKHTFRMVIDVYDIWCIVLTGPMFVWKGTRLFWIASLLFGLSLVMSGYLPAIPLLTMHLIYTGNIYPNLCLMLITSENSIQTFSIWFDHGYAFKHEPHTTLIHVKHLQVSQLELLNQVFKLPV